MPAATRRQTHRGADGLLLALFILAASWHVVPAVAQDPRIERNVVYRSGGSADQTLDLYVPAARDFATVIFVHGGSLQESGERRSSPVYADVCHQFVTRGVGCATIDYRLAPAHRWPAMPEDVAAAVRWVRDHVPAQGGDPRRLFLFGHSSGCHLAALVGANAAYLQGVGLTPDDLAGVIPMGCLLAPVDALIRGAQARGIELDSLRTLWDRRPDEPYTRFDDYLDADPSRFVGSHVPPVLIVIARAERFRPPILEQAAHFVDLMYEAGRPADLVIVPGAHMSSIGTIGGPGDPTLDAILRFIDDPDAAGAGSRPSSVR